MCVRMADLIWNISVNSSRFDAVLLEPKVKGMGPPELYYEVNVYCVLPPRGPILTKFLCVISHAQNTVRVNAI